MPLSPMMQQYHDIKTKHPDAILFFRLGDFYEMFFEDAITASRELELTLTGRDCGEAERAPMCGVPHHSADGYIARLVAKGYRVALCEQMEAPTPGAGIVRRDVVRIITRGTVTDPTQLDEERNNYICSIYRGEDGIGIAFADVSVGIMYATQWAGKAEELEQAVLSQVGAYSPSEVITNANLGALGKTIEERLSLAINPPTPGYYKATAVDALLALLPHVAERRPRGANESAYRAAAALLGYMEEHLRVAQVNLKDLVFYSGSNCLEMDAASRRSLELTENIRDGGKRGSLLWVLDHTQTAAGARLLRKCVGMPLLDKGEITRRQDAVAELFGDFMLREELAQGLDGVLDLERLLTRLVYGNGNGRDLLAVAATLGAVPKIVRLLGSVSSPALADIRGVDPCADICEHLGRAINENPPATVREGGIIAAGYNSDVDRLRSIVTGAKTILDELEASEREATGIKNLKIGYNRVFGYYLEVSKSNTAAVPQHYIRKQTLTNGERYITAELKELEDTILKAGDKLSALEHELFVELCAIVTEAKSRISDCAEALAQLDFYYSLATAAAKHNYIRPELTEGDEIRITEGRHPVVERFVRDSYFVPNDTRLDTADNRFMLITGPNMAGKSTYMRQTALICVMAQIGSFVPAQTAKLSIVDRVFTRIGASDDLSSGQSTFMLEMSEVAYILANATQNSLIIYDEIGRGTSTYDGMSIARAVAEHTAGVIGAKTMFATHYHELTTLEGTVEGVRNYHISARKKGDTVVFLRKIVQGGADESYGIEVAGLAGVPNSVIRRAKEVLSDLEQAAPAPVAKPRKSAPPATPWEQEVVQRIRAIDVNTLTPIEAMNLLYQMKKGEEV
ncbi:MAG: DNA mismatch repair protein MutS [Oscillospiraceae bacterium]|nr:DNA mismatch repair protein MutS [Oscillospiraceae bacterium]